MSAYLFPGQTGFYRGKVRDVFTINENYLVIIASNRISAFDVILPKEIPYKGQVLNQIAASMLNSTVDICPNWLLDVPAPNTAVGKKCIPFKIEMVVRGNLTGHAWRTYNSGKRILCGVPMPDGMKENDFFPVPIITPSTKASEGHDEDISKEEIILQGLATAGEWKQLEDYALKLFARGKEIAAGKGLILVDTKYEFGKIGDTIYLMDEIHTPDSSRYFYADSLSSIRDEDKQSKVVPITSGKPKQLSKEFVREWLIENNFMGQPGQKVPDMSNEWVQTISQRYIELYEKLIGKKFVPEKLNDQDVFEKINNSLKRI